MSFKKLISQKLHFAGHILCNKQNLRPSSTHLKSLFLLFNEKIQITKFLPKFFLSLITNLDQIHRDLFKIMRKIFGKNFVNSKKEGLQ